jgi:hypothetical protein
MPGELTDIQNEKTPLDVNAKQAILQAEVGYKLLLVTPWYKPQKMAFPKSGVVSLFPDKITITDENSMIVFEALLTTLSKFRRSIGSIAFNSDTQVIGLDFGFEGLKSTMTAAALGGGAMLVAAKKGEPIAKEWQSQIEKLGQQFKKFWLGGS